MDYIEKYNGNPKLLKNEKIRKKVIDVLYKMIHLSNFRYKLLETENDLALLKQTKYYISPNYNGTNCLLYFIKINNEYFSFLIDRSTLKYDIRQVDINKIRIIPISIRLDRDVYNGTIIDGILLYQPVNGQKVFVINDVYYLCGDNLTKDKMKYKMLNMQTYINNNIVEDPVTNDIKLHVSYIKPATDILDFAKSDMYELPFKQHIKGVIFYPEISGTKLILHFGAV